MICRFLYPLVKLRLSNNLVHSKGQRLQNMSFSVYFVDLLMCCLLIICIENITNITKVTLFSVLLFFFIYIN